MDDRTLREKAVAFTALSAFCGGDEEKAWAVLSSLNADFSSPFASYTREFTHTAEEEASFNSIWRDVRSAFDSCRIPFSIEEYSSPLSTVRFLYWAGDRTVLDGKRICFLGAVMPSLQARKDTAEAVIEAVRKGWTVVAPFESGLGPYALSVAVKEGGRVCAVLSSELSKCPNENLLSLMENIYTGGLLLSQFSPYTKREKWHVVLRNRFLSSFCDVYFMAEEKDGGPGWAVFDAAMKNGRKCALSYSSVTNPNYAWCGERALGGAVTIRKNRDLAALLSLPKKRKKTESGNQEPDLFSFLGNE